MPISSPFFLIKFAGMDLLEGWKALGIVGSSVGRFLFERGSLEMHPNWLVMCSKRCS
jgi:hypothetical protein